MYTQEESFAFFLVFSFTLTYFLREKIVDIVLECNEGINYVYILKQVRAHLSVMSVSERSGRVPWERRTHRVEVNVKGLNM